MIYEVYIDNTVAFYPGDEKCAITNAVLSEAINTVRTFEFDIYPTNPAYDCLINSEHSILGYSSVTIKDIEATSLDDEIVFFGKIMEITTDINFCKHVYVRGIEGEALDYMYYMNDVRSASTDVRFLCGSIIDAYQTGTLLKNTFKPNTQISITFNPTHPGITYNIIKCDVQTKKWYKSQAYSSDHVAIVDSPIMGIRINNTTSDSYPRDLWSYIRITDYEFKDDLTTETWTQVIVSEDYFFNRICAPTYLTERYYPEGNSYRIITIHPFKQAVVRGVSSSSCPNYSEYNIPNNKDSLTVLREIYLDRWNQRMEAYRNNGKYPTYEIYAGDNYVYGSVSNQPIEFGKNLISCNVTENFDNVFTRLNVTCKNAQGIEISLYGAPVDNYHRNSSDLYISSPTKELEYGTIVAYKEFNNCTSQTDLLNFAEQYLDEHSEPRIVIEASALDLSAINPEYDAFRVGDYAIIKASPLGIDDLQVMITSKKTYLNDMAKNTITLGDTAYEGYTAQVKNSFSANNILGG